MAAGRPNVLIFMADQMTPLALPFHGAWPTVAPSMQRLAEAGVVFDSAYCNVPLCGPARAALMTGRLASRIGAFDNAAEFPADTPTFAHALRLGGYRTILSGKMHFCGADQLHGFEERLTTDIYPSDFAWTPRWDRPGERQSWYHGMGSVLDAGPCVRTNQLDFDDEVVFEAERKLFEIARDDDDRPFLMVVSMTHPHDPFAMPAAWWDRYRDEEVPMPRHRLPVERSDPHARRIRAMCETDLTPPSEAQIRAARRAYMAAISYVDDALGRLQAALAAIGADQSTVTIILSDHGEMLGERGLWYKMTFFEGASRIPLVVHAPNRFRPRRVAASVGAVDLLPTLLDLASLPPHPLPIEGRSLLTHLEGGRGHDEVVAEYMAEGALAPIVMIRRDRWKFIHSPADPDMLFDLEGDPEERVDLASAPGHRDLVRQFQEEVAQRWDLPALDREVRASQARRVLVHAANAAGRRRTAWDFQPFTDARERYVRSHMPLDDIEAAARFPRP